MVCILLTKVAKAKDLMPTLITVQRANTVLQYPSVRSSFCGRAAHDLQKARQHELVERSGRASPDDVQNRNENDHCQGAASCD